MAGPELEYCLNEAYQKARDARHEYMTVEHLLLSILDAPRVREILKACGADLARLQAELQKFIVSEMARWGKAVRAHNIRAD